MAPATGATSEADRASAWISADLRHTVVKLEPIVVEGFMDIVFTVDHPGNDWVYGWRATTYTAFLSRRSASKSSYPLGESDAKDVLVLHRVSDAKCLEADRRDATEVYIFFRFHVSIGTWSLFIPQIGGEGSRATINVIRKGTAVPTCSLTKRALWDRVSKSHVFSKERNHIDRSSQRDGLEAVEEEDEED